MKTVLITGASRGIGAQTARIFAENGYRVIINYNKSKDAAEVLAKELGASIICADVSQKSDVELMFSQIQNEFGGVDILVNNAGIAQAKMFTDITEEEWDDMFSVNVKGIFNCTKAALPYMIHKKSGKIINISSIWGITGASCEVHYSASKAAVIGLTKALAKELGPSGITVNCVAPGVIETDMCASLSQEDISALKDETPLGCIGTPDDIAKTVLFLASGGGDFLTGQVISPNGGMVI
ncbi:MAG: SDR family oxidoreductase [Ruminococcaceae bacterium]|nr:SDR family oxidoreductase [Oscillospiraceae bacterium]